MITILVITSTANIRERPQLQPHEKTRRFGESIFFTFLVGKEKGVSLDSRNLIFVLEGTT
jgi:hypothetical protein